MATESKRNVGSLLAHASWGVFVVWIFVNGLLRGVGLGIIGDLLAMVTIPTALVLSVTALFTMKRFGRRGILVPALIGLLLVSLSLLIFIPNLLAGIERGRAMRGASAMLQ